MTAEEKKETYEVLDHGKYSSFTIIDRKTSYCTYVVCYMFSPEDYTWAQGFYFNSEKEAYTFFYQKEQEGLASAIEQLGWEENLD